MHELALDVKSFNKSLFKPCFVYWMFNVLGVLLYLFFQQHSCCQYGIIAGNDASDNGSIGGYDCLMIPGIWVKLFMFSHT